MRIGIDAKWYASGNPSGLVVVRNLVDNIILQSHKHNHEILLFANKSDKYLLKGLEEKIKPLESVQIVYCIKALNFLSNMFILPFYLRKYKIDVCLVQNFTPLFFNTNIKYVNYIHDFLFFDYPQYFTWIERTVFKLMKSTSSNAKEIITISKSERARIKRYIPNKKIHVVYHGVSDAFSVENRNDLVTLKYMLPKKFILYLGRINTRKNIEVILKAIKNDETLLPLVIIGKKDHKSFDIDLYIKENAIDKRVFLLGHLPFEDLKVLISNAHIFVFPSFAEGFGMPPLESMKSGVPVIASNVSCMPEICGNAALYFNPYNSDELIRQIRNLMSDNSLYEQVVEKGFKQVEKYKWNKASEKIMSILTQQQ